MVRWDYYRRMAVNYLKEPERIGQEMAAAKRRKEAKGARLAPLPTTPAAEVPVVVSLTSYGARVQRVSLAIRSIMDQTVRPNKVILWLGEDANDVSLPKDLTDLERVGLEIRRGVADLKGHKKYYFAMQELTDCLLVTIDDDLVYAKDTIETLLSAHKALPDCVIARRCHHIDIKDGEIAPYETWEMNYQDEVTTPRKSLLATTGAGTLYPSSCFAALTGDADEISEFALSADDLWMKALETKAHILVACAPNDLPMPWVMPMSQSKGLFFENLHDGGTDRILARLMDHFGLTTDDFTDEG